MNHKEKIKRNQDERIQEHIRMSMIRISRAQKLRNREMYDDAVSYYCGFRMGVMMCQPNRRWQKRFNKIYESLKEGGFFNEQKYNRR